MRKVSEIGRREFLKVGALSAAGLPALSGRTASPSVGAFGGGAQGSDKKDVLKAGVAKVDITPPLGLPMWGSGGRKRIAQGILDQLYARVLALEVGDRRLALVTLDLGRSFGEASLASLRKTVKDSSNVSCLIAAASHTHSGPTVRTHSSNGTPTWETVTLDKIAKAVDSAFENLAEVQLGVGYGIADIAYNRRRISPDGRVLMLWSNPTRVPTAPVDPTATILRVDRADGTPLAVLVNYACHAVSFGGNNLQYSADWPGSMANVVEASMRHEPLCLFLQGAAGDINPYYATMPFPNGAVELREWTAQRIGEEVARVAKEIRTHIEPSPEIQFREDLLTVQTRWNQEAHRKAVVEELGPGALTPHSPPLDPQVSLPVSTVLINRRIAWMTVPGEPFVEFQMNWRGRCPVPYAFFLGYANEYYGYIPTLLAAAQGGYGAADAMTYVAVGTGERIVDHALIRTYEMLGKLSDIPSGQLASVKS